VLKTRAKPRAAALTACVATASLLEVGRGDRVGASSLGFLAAFHKERRFPITRSVQVLFSASLGELGGTAQGGVELSTPQLDRGSCGERTRRCEGVPGRFAATILPAVEENSPGNAVTSALPPASGAQPVSPVSPQGPSVPCRLCQSGLLPFRCRTLSPPCAVASKRQGARAIPPG
jgi:hypothetical protein